MEGEEFRICPNCGYEKGFHVYFKGLSEENMKIGLICPSCGQSYDIGWLTPDIKKMDVEWKERF